MSTGGAGCEVNLESQGYLRSRSRRSEKHSVLGVGRGMARR